MRISSRTPEGLPSRCTVCGAETYLEFSDPSGDAPCPSCGHLLWLSAELLSSLQNRFADILGIASSSIMPDTNLKDVGADSLSKVELIMTIEAELDEPISEDDANSIYTIGDLIRYIEQRKRRDSGSVQAGDGNNGEPA